VTLWDPLSDLVLFPFLIPPFFSPLFTLSNRISCRHFATLVQRSACPSNPPPVSYFSSSSIFAGVLYSLSLRHGRRLGVSTTTSPSLQDFHYIWTVREMSSVFSPLVSPLLIPPLIFCGTFFFPPVPLTRASVISDRPTRPPPVFGGLLAWDLLDVFLFSV